MDTIHMTVLEFSTKIKTTKDIAYCLVQYFEKAGMVARVGMRKEPGAKGAGQVVYAFPKNLGAAMAELLNGALA